MRRALMAAVLVFALPALVWAVAAQTRTSFTPKRTTIDYRSWQAIRCDVSASIAGDGPEGGETCEAGDWSAAMDCQGMDDMVVQYHEYGSGSGSVLIWNCSKPLGSIGPPTKRGNQVAGIDGPGVEAPSSAPSAADPDPLCVQLGNAMDGTTNVANQRQAFTGQTFDFIIVEQDACATNCDGTIEVACSR